MKQIRIILAGGSPLLQAGIAAVLGQDPSLKLIDHLPGDGIAVPRISDQAGDVLLLNTDSPHHDVGTIIHQLPESPPSIRLLVLTDSESVDEMRATLRLGISGYGIRSALQPEDLLSAVRTVSAGRLWACAWTISRLITTVVDQEPSKITPWGRKLPVSERELAVLRLAATGARETDIAAQLYVSPNTVKTYLRRIRQKFNVESRADAVRLAVASGLLPPTSTNGQ